VYDLNTSINIVVSLPISFFIEKTRKKFLYNVSLDHSIMVSNGIIESQTKIAVRGLDHYSRDEIEKFWREKSPENPKIRAIGLSTPKICNLGCVYCYAGSDRA